MKVAAYQAPLLPAGSMDALRLIRMQMERCEADGVSILCCPEAILGGLADYDADPSRFAIPADRLDSVLAPVASDRVTSIVGFTEVTEDGALYNSAAVFRKGAVAGVYRKLHPAINRSVYRAGRDIPVFQSDGLTFGIVICNDSNFIEPSRTIAAQAATALFVPSNNAMPAARSTAQLVSAARDADIARAAENRMWVIRADVAGRRDTLVSYGSSGIVDPAGCVRVSAQRLTDHLLIARL